MTHNMLSITPQDQLVTISHTLRVRSQELSLFVTLDYSSVVLDKELPGEPIVEPVFASILLALADLEFAFQSVLSPKCQIYLLGFAPLHELMRLQNELFSEADVRTASSVLHGIGLVYRLPSAVKFSYPPIQIPQIRISGWGVLAARDLLGICPDHPSKRQIYIIEQLRKHSHDYEELIKACSISERPLDIAVIHRLNTSVPIPIVT